ncbi:MAG: hypothetical protein Q8R96_02235 [Bacteroidota bacterium]|nr:hypothetical protein [Bacteroidota bacterium]
MVFIPGGSFVMGGDSLCGRSDEFPRHEVKVSLFYMDQLVDLLRLIPNPSDKNSFRNKKQLIKRKRKGQRRM